MCNSFYFVLTALGKSLFLRKEQSDSRIIEFLFFAYSIALFMQKRIVICIITQEFYADLSSP